MSYRNSIRDIVSQFKSKKKSKKFKNIDYKNCVAIGIDDNNNHYFALSGGIKDYDGIDPLYLQMRNSIRGYNDFINDQKELKSFVEKQRGTVTLNKLTDCCKTMYNKINNNLYYYIGDTSLMGFKSLSVPKNVNNSFSCVERKIIFNCKNRFPIKSLYVSRKPCDFCKPYTNKPGLKVKGYRW